MESGDLTDKVYLHFQEAFDEAFYLFFKKTRQMGIRKKVMAWRCV